MPQDGVTGRSDLWSGVYGGTLFNRALGYRAEQADVEAAHQCFEISACVAFEVPMGETGKRVVSVPMPSTIWKSTAFSKSPAPKADCAGPVTVAGRSRDDAGVHAEVAGRRRGCPTRRLGCAQRHREILVVRVGRCRQFARIQVEYEPVAEYPLYAWRVRQIRSTALE